MEFIPILIRHPIRAIKSWFYVTLVNRYVHCRFKRHLSQERALKKALLKKETLKRLMDRAINLQMKSIGRFTRGPDWEVLALALKVLADLAHVLPEPDAEEIKILVLTLTEHNWGGVRRAAQTALPYLPGYIPDPAA